MKTRNSEVLADFVAYCEANPSQRFWQALRNWMGGHNFLLTSTHGPFELTPKDDRPVSIQDTFYWEGRNG